MTAAHPVPPAHSTGGAPARHVPLSLSAAWLRLAAVALTVAVCGGCHEPFPSDVSDVTSRATIPAVLRLATTTSARDSGLLEVLLPPFEARQKARVDVIAVGTGAALALGEAGDADVLLVHAPSAEQAFMDAGHGVRRETFMYNRFLLLGPPADPVGIGGAEPTDALRSIASQKASFISRGDDSGTHKKERALWSEAKVDPAWNEYLESGQGMGASLIMADELRAYILADEGTYLRFAKKVDLVPLVTEGEQLRNPYSAIVVDPAKHPRIRGELAGTFVEFLLDQETQQRIRDFRLEGQALFVPTRISGE